MLSKTWINMRLVLALYLYIINLYLIKKKNQGVIKEITVFLLFIDLRNEISFYIPVKIFSFKFWYTFIYLFKEFAIKISIKILNEYYHWFFVLSYLPFRNFLKHLTDRSLVEDDSSRFFTQELITIEVTERKFIF